MISIIISAFALGILGSLHCIGMCGPLVMSMPFQKVENGKLLFASLSYHFGKTMTYGLMGILAGAIGQGFAFLKWQQILSVFAGVILIAITLMPMLKEKFKISLPLQNWFSTIFAKMGESPKLKYFVAFGFLNGLLPCGLVYTALAGAAVSSSMVNGVIFMIFFGLGTIPSLTSIILFQNKVSAPIRKYLFKSSYYISLVIGVLLILRGFNLGIPYISPSFNSQTQEMSCCHKH